MLSKQLKEDLELILCGDRVPGKLVRKNQADAKNHYRFDDPFDPELSHRKEDDYEDDKYSRRDMSFWTGAKLGGASG